MTKNIHGTELDDATLEAITGGGKNGGRAADGRGLRRKRQNDFHAAVETVVNRGKGKGKGSGTTGTGAELGAELERGHRDAGRGIRT